MADRSDRCAARSAVMEHERSEEKRDLGSDLTERDTEETQNQAPGPPRGSSRDARRVTRRGPIERLGGWAPGPGPGS
jgi:hypothetical protein